MINIIISLLIGFILGSLSTYYLIKQTQQKKIIEKYESKLILMRQEYEQTIKDLTPTKQQFDSEIKPQNKSNQSNKTYSISEIRKIHPRAYAYWTKEEDLRLIKRYQEGASIDQLAKEFQRKSGGIQSRLKKLGLILS